MIEVKSYFGTKYNIPEELFDTFIQLDSKAIDYYNFDLADNYNAAFELIVYFREYEVK